ncbi:glycosyltransferase [Helicobacter sp. 16-1353]|uniref:glycosyltransferase family 4 protein n=1 Tax=Helicobacter sp. 16-1353 TaxID=2004996 RepID=UPI0023EEED42|nr:glycosyltransferase [Helicobacter sp. 16-1353]
MLYKIYALPQKVADIRQNPSLYPNTRQNQALKLASTNLRNLKPQLNYQDFTLDSTLDSKNPNPQTRNNSQRKLRILHLASDNFQGGAESVFRNTIEITAKDFIIYTASCDREIAESQKHIILDDYQNYNKILGVLKYIFNLKNYRILSGALKTLKPDIIHTQNYLSRLSPSVLFALKKYKKYNSKVRLIYTQHGFGACANLCFYNYNKNAICEECKNKSQIRIAWKNCDRRGRIYSILKSIRTLFYQGIFLKEQNLFDKIIFVSNFQMQKHLEAGYDAQKCVVITNPIDKKFYNPNVSLADKENLIVFFGRICAEKNVELLIKAFRMLVNEPEFSKYRLLIIGNGERKEKCKNLAKRLFGDLAGNLGEIQKDKIPAEIQGSEILSANTPKIPQANAPKPLCEFISHLSPSELKEILKKSKISVLPSLWYETFGLTILESILAGAFPLMSDIGALSETKESFGGVTFKLDNGENLYIALKNTLENYEEFFKKIPSYQKNIIETTNDKNYLNALANAYKITTADDMGGGGGILLVLEIFSHISKVNSVIFMDRLPPECLKNILKNAKISILPSLLYETFGLTIVESILSGSIPLSSDIGALSETSKEFGGFRFIPNSKHSLKDSMRAILLNYEENLTDLLVQQKKLETHNKTYEQDIKSLYFSEFKE